MTLQAHTLYRVAYNLGTSLPIKGKPVVFLRHETVYGLNWAIVKTLDDKEYMVRPSGLIALGVK